jgi:hypothetical protein
VGSVGSDPKKNRMHQRVRMRQEAVDRRFKQFGILKQVYLHDVEDRGTFLRVMVFLVPLSLVMGEPLFNVEYSNL